MTTLFLDGSTAQGKFVELIRQLSHSEVKVVSDDSAATQLTAVAAGSTLPALVKGSDVKSGAVAVAKALLAGSKNESLLGKAAEIDTFVTSCFGETVTALSGDLRSQLTTLHKYCKQIEKVTFIFDDALSIADLALLVVVHPYIPKLGDKQKYDLVSIIRWYDHIQHQKLLEGVIAPYKLEFVLDLPKPEAKTPAPKEKKEGEEKTKKENVKVEATKEAKGKQTAAAKASTPVVATLPEGEAANADADFHRVDFRVGKIVECSKHPEADSLYVEKIDLGEESGPRTIVSGLVKFVPLADMQNRLVVVVANLKPAKLKGILSAGMVLAASNADHTQVEIVDPPAGAKVGERVTFAGYSGEADAQLNPKKKIFEAVKPDLHTDDAGVAHFKQAPFMTSAGPCTVVSLKNASIG